MGYIAGKAKRTVDIGSSELTAALSSIFSFTQALFFPSSIFSTLIDLEIMLLFLYYNVI